MTALKQLKHRILCMPMGSQNGYIQVASGFEDGELAGKGDSGRFWPCQTTVRIRPLLKKTSLSPKAKVAIESQSRLWQLFLLAGRG